MKTPITTSKKERTSTCTEHPQISANGEHHDVQQNNCTSQEPPRKQAKTSHTLCNEQEVCTEYHIIDVHTGALAATLKNIGDVVTIGRSTGCHLTFPMDAVTVSRAHVRLELRGEQENDKSKHVVATDMSSTATLINSRVMHNKGEQVMMHLDTIANLDNRFKYRIVKTS